MSIHRKPSQPEHGKPRRPRRIYEDGSPVEDTARFPVLRFVLGRSPQPEASDPLPVLHSQERGSHTVALRVPVAPDAPTEPLAVADPFPRNFFTLPAFAQEVRSFQELVHDGWYQLARGFDERMAAMEARSQRLKARVRGWTLDGADADLAAAYAEGGTEQVLKLTPQVLAVLDERHALAGSAATS